VLTMFGMVVVRAMEMTMPYLDDKCPKCGREGCTCDPDNCDCGEPTPETDQSELVQDFEE